MPDDRVEEGVVLGRCDGCGADITDLDDVAAGMHVVEGPPKMSMELRWDEMRGDFFEEWYPDDPRYPCGPVAPLEAPGE